MRMSARVPDSRFLQHQRKRACVLACGLLVLALASCKAKSGADSGHGPNQLVAPPAEMPEYSVAEGLETKHPEIVRFLNAFMHTCLAGDYDRYRDLVSRYENPETRERFQAIYHSLKRMSIIGIEALSPIERSTACFLITCEVEFREGKPVSRRQRARQLAFLVVEEQSVYRVRRAPGKLQPHNGNPTPE